MNLSYGKKRIAHAYMLKHIEDRNEEINGILSTMLGDVEG